MSDNTSNWSNAELKAYVLLYCAYADFNESPEETALIVSKVGRQEYNRIHVEFEKDNDYARIQKIQHGIANHNYSKDQIEVLFKEIHELFMTDGEEGILEQNAVIGLQHLLR
jgi:hypothetical protein